MFYSLLSPSSPHPPRCPNTKLHLVLLLNLFKFLLYLTLLGPENKCGKHFIWQMKTRNKTTEICGQLLGGLNKTQIKLLLSLITSCKAYIISLFCSFCTAPIYFKQAFRMSLTQPKPLRNHQLLPDEGFLVQEMVKNLPTLKNHFRLLYLC